MKSKEARVVHERGFAFALWKIQPGEWVPVELVG